jgi:hypothetical protein
MTDVGDEPELPADPVPDPRPPAIDPTPVDGAAELPADVKNGEVPGEDDPAIADRPVTTDE